MNETPKEPNQGQEDRIVQRAVDALAEDRLLEEALTEELRGGPGETLMRLYTELLGLLPYDLESAAPPAAIRRTILTGVRGDETQPVEDLGPPAAGAAGLPAPEPAVAPAGRWLLALAASLALALVGVSGWLFYQVEEQQATIVRLTHRLQAMEDRTADLRLAREQLARARARLDLMSAPAVEICPLRPVGEDPVQPQARGVLYVSPDRGRWHLAVRGLLPSPEGSAYQVWFVGEGEVVSGGTFHVAPGTVVELTDGSMPPTMTAVSITLEPAAGADRPSGPTILYGDEAMQLL